MIILAFYFLVHAGFLIIVAGFYAAAVVASCRMGKPASQISQIILHLFVSIFVASPFFAAYYFEKSFDLNIFNRPSTSLVFYVGFVLSSLPALIIARRIMRGERIETLRDE